MYNVDTKKEREEIKMRTIIYSVYNKETNEKVYSHWDRNECVKVLDTLDKEKFVICYEWRSF